MLRRLLHSLMTFVALIVAYQAYVLVAVPWLDPPLVTRDNRARNPTQRGEPNPVTKYQRLLAHYFPADHWSLQRPPIVIANADKTGMLVLDGYEHDDHGKVTITRCVALGFPTPLQDGLAAPADAVIVEAPQGARLQFDESFRLERGQIGEIKSGEFPGRIIIRSGMRSPGTEDDLRIETSDLSMNDKLLYTSSPVRFRMGPNIGGGRELEIRFLDEAHAGPSKSGWRMDAFASLEIRRDVRLRLFLESDSLLPSSGKPPQSGEQPPSQAERGNEQLRRLPATLAATDASQKSRQAAKPVEVTCTGPFYFDLVQYVASFDRNVELRQINPDGPSDQLSGQKLDIHFTPRGEAMRMEKRTVAEAARQQKDDLVRLEASLVVAQGHPVVVVSPSRSAEARGERIELGLRNQSLKIAGGQDARLVYGPNVLRAPIIEYEQPQKDSGTRIGSFRATGPGTLYYVLDPAKPDQVFVAAWQTSVEMTREEGQPVITLTGRPQVSASNMGRLLADEIRVRLREEPQAGGQPKGLSLPGQDGKSVRELGVQLDLTTAVGNVQIESPQITGRTNQLVVSFRYSEAAGASPYAVQSDEAASSNAAPKFELTGADGAAGQRYYIESDDIRLQAILRGNRAAPTDLTCSGNVLFREIPVQRTRDEPMEVRGGQLLATNLDAAAHITIRGTESAYSPAASAELRARGMTVVAPSVELDQGQNRLWIDTAGKATMMVTRELGSQAARPPYPLEIRWQGGLNFDGRIITFDRDVLVQGDDAWLRCDRMAAKLTAPVEFGKSANPDAIDLEEIDCQGNVILDQRTRDEVGPISHQRMRLPRLIVNQQSGKINGVGPGVVRSTHFSDQRNLFAGPALPQQVVNDARPRLHFLRIDFQHSLAGKLYDRELVFHRRVRTVYGPVDSWEQELDLGQPEILPPDTVLLSCDELRVSEDALAARAAASAVTAVGQQIGPVQLVAQGNVRLDGRHSTHGSFGTQADRASYEQSKDTILIEGNARTPALFWQQRPGGAASTPLYARKIRYNLATGLPKVEGGQYSEFTPPPAASQNARGTELIRQK